MKIKSNTVWIDITGEQYTDFSQIEDRYLKNIAYAVANRKGNVSFLMNNKKAIDAIFEEVAKRKLFYNNYDMRLKTMAYNIWLQNKEDDTDRIVNEIISESIRLQREELEEDLEDD